MTDTLYYDGQCPLCVKEMDRLREIKDESLILKDIHTLSATDHGNDGNGPNTEALLRVLHLERNGEYITGIDANIAAWEHTRFGALWRWMRWPLIRPVVERVYDRWAKWRYDRLYKH